MNNKTTIAALSTSLLLSQVAVAKELAGSKFTASKVNTPIVIDGVIDKQWQDRAWFPMNQHILGQKVSKQDFDGRFKLAWDNSYLYLLAEIQDDVLFDQHANPLDFYWDDDCLEVFLDEDASGGEHQYNYNAFAYHVALDNQVVDIGEKTAQNPAPFLTLNDHINSRWQRSEVAPHKVVWELAIKVFDDSFSLDKKVKPVKLTKGKELGFMFAYCDNDGSKHRESFIGSTEILGVNGDKNLGYKTADVFGKLTLVK